MFNLINFEGRLILNFFCRFPCLWKVQQLNITQNLFFSFDDFDRKIFGLRHSNQMGRSPTPLCIRNAYLHMLHGLLGTERNSRPNCNLYSLHQDFTILPSYIGILRETTQRIAIWRGTGQVELHASPICGGPIKKRKNSLWQVRGFATLKILCINKLNIA